MSPVPPMTLRNSVPPPPPPAPPSIARGKRPVIWKMGGGGDEGGRVRRRWGYAVSAVRGMAERREKGETEAVRERGM